MRICLLLSESQNSVILDSECTLNVAGTLSIDCFLKRLGKACDLNKVKNILSTNMFRFGGVEIKTSLGQIRFPCNLASKTIFIKTDITNSNILLASNLI